MKKTEIFILVAFVFCLIGTYFNIKWFNYLFFIAHLAFISILLIQLIKEFNLEQLIRFLYKMQFATAILFYTNEYPGANYFYITGFVFACISIVLTLFSKRSSRNILEPLLFINIGSFILFALR